MFNPIRTEADAFRFVWLTIAYFALIVGGSAISTWLGVTVFVCETALVGWWIVTHRRRTQAIPHVPPARAEGGHRILVVANETVEGHELLTAIRRRAEGVDAHVLVVCPALNSPLKHWVSDEDAARLAAQRRLEASLAAMRAAGVEASGEIGDGDPLQAIEDAIRTFAPDELIISTHPEGRSNWLETGLVEATRERFAIPVAHVIVDRADEVKPVD